MIRGYLFYTLLQLALAVALVGTVLVIDLLRRNPPLD